MTQKHASYVHYTYYKLAIVDFFFFMENSCAGKAKAWFYAGQFNGCGKFCQVTKTCKNQAGFDLTTKSCYTIRSSFTKDRLKKLLKTF